MNVDIKYLWNILLVFGILITLGLSEQMPGLFALTALFVVMLISINAKL